jgi:hypothetical protein
MINPKKPATANSPSEVYFYYKFLINCGNSNMLCKSLF